MVYAHWVGPVLHGSAVIGFGSCVISVDFSLTLENSPSAVQVPSVRHIHIHTLLYMHMHMHMHTHKHKHKHKQTETIILCTHIYT